MRDSYTSSGSENWTASSAEEDGSWLLLSSDCSLKRVSPERRADLREARAAFLVALRDIIAIYMLLDIIFMEGVRGAYVGWRRCESKTKATVR